MNVLTVLVGLKGFAMQAAHHICVSSRHTMTNLAFVSLFLLTVMVSSGSAQGKKSRYSLYICIFYIHHVQHCSISH